MASVASHPLGGGLRGLVAAFLLLLPLAFGCRTFSPSPTEKSEAPATALKVLPDAAPVPEPPIAYLAPPLDAGKVFVQSVDLDKKTALIVGLTGAADPSVTRVFAQNSSTGETIDFPVDGGSFQATMTNTKPGDLVLLWTACPDCSAGGPGINSIEKKVQYWHKWFPGSVRSLAMTSSGLFVGDNDGLFFFKSADLDKDPTEIPPARIFTQAEGLLSNRIDLLADDGHGGVWLGSLGIGVSHAVFPDGMSGPPVFTHHQYNVEVPRSFAYATAKSLEVNEYGGLLMCSTNFEGVIYDLFHLSASASAGSAPVPVQSGCDAGRESDGQGGYWSAWLSDLIHTDENGKIQKYPFRNEISTLALDPRGVLWVGFANGELTYVVPDNSGLLRRFRVPMPEALFATPIKAILPDAYGRVWVGHGNDTSNGSLRRFTGEFNSLLDAPFYRRGDLPSNTIHAVARDSSGAFWIGTGRGLVRMDPSRDSAGFELFELNGVSPTRAVLSLAFDATGKLWAGTAGNGVYRIDPKERKALANFSFALDNVVSALEPGGSGGMWVGTGVGLSEILLSPDGKTSLVRYPDKGLFVDIRSLKYVPPSEPGKEGALWIGGSRVPVSGPTRVPDGDDIPGQVKFFRVPFVDGRPWVVSGRLDFDAFPDAGGPAAQGIFGIEADGDGGVWAASDRGLIHMRRDLSIEHLATAEGLPSPAVQAIVRNERGGFWVGTDQGVVHLTFVGGVPKITVVTAADGLPSNSILSLLSLGPNELLIGTANGLAIFRDGGGT